MPDEGTKLVMENLSKNLADQDEYPETVKIQTRCVSMSQNYHQAKSSFVLTTSD